VLSRKCLLYAVVVYGITGSTYSDVGIDQYVEHLTIIKKVDTKESNRQDLYTYRIFWHRHTGAVPLYGASISSRARVFQRALHLA